MSPQMQLKTTEAVKLMEKLDVSFKKCRHHIRGFVIVNGKRVLAVHCSNGKKDMPGKIPHRFRESLKLSVDEFETLRGCTLDREAYIKLLREKGVV